MSSAMGRDELIDRLQEVLRDNGSRGMLLHQAVAERYGLNPTDLKCLDLARSEEGLTAGRLAEITGMSTSAITAVLDRMERAGFLERVRDPRDRRRVIVRTGTRASEVTERMSPLQEATKSLLDKYDEPQLRLLLEFTDNLNQLMWGITDTITKGRASG